MWEKIKSFLKKTWVQVLAWVLALVGGAVLLLDGVTVAEIGEALKTLAGIGSLIGVLIAFIIGKIKK